MPALCCTVRHLPPPPPGEDQNLPIALFLVSGTFLRYWLIILPCLCLKISPTPNNPEKTRSIPLHSEIFASEGGPLSFHKMHRKQGNEVKSANLVALCGLLKPFLRGALL